MSLTALIPAILCTIALFFWTPARVFRTVALPVLLLLPLYYPFKFALLPPIDFWDAAMFPLGVALFIDGRRSWRFSIMDLWLFLFFLSTGVADRLSGYSTGSAFELFDNFCKLFVPYMIGKQLIEQDGARAETLRRIATLMCGAAIVAMYEFQGMDNLFRAAFKPIFKHVQVPWVTQIRHGYGRIAGPYAQAELAGITFLVGFMITLYLARYYDWGARFRSVPWLPIRKAYLVAAVLLVALFMTQSRGPEIGLLFAVPIALVGRSRQVLRAAVIATVLMTVVGYSSYKIVMKIAQTAAPGEEDQSSAEYRAILIENYMPIAEQGGPWGFGLAFHPVGKQQSIDNEYLFVWLTQGWVGLASLLLLISGTVYHLVCAAIYNPEKRDRSFAFTLLGIFVGILVTAATVFLGDFPLVIFFMMIGWSQSLNLRSVRQERPVFQQVYT